MVEKRYLRRLLEKIFFVEILKGLALTFHHFVSPAVTRQYPFEKRAPFPGSRALHALVRDAETGKERCVGCGLCAAMCPSQCIRVYTTDGDGHRKVVVDYQIEVLRCIFCAYCVEACPFGAITLTPVFDYADYSRRPFDLTKDRLLDNWDNYMAGSRGADYLDKFWRPRRSDFGRP